MTKKIAGAAILFCLIAAALYVYVVGRPLALSKNTALSFDLPEDIREILYYASMAPSGHNTQPWKVTYSKQAGTFTLAFDTSRELTQVDPHNREAFISLGAFLENWKQAAQAYGYTASVTILPEPDSTVNVAHIALIPAGSRPADAQQRLAHILARMLGRHTDKRMYEPRPIPEKSINTIIEKNRPYLHFYAKGTPEYAWLVSSTVEAMSAQAHHEGKRIELADWFRFSNAEARQTKDGLPAEQLGLQGPLKALFYTLYNREAAGKESFALEAVNKTEQQASSAAGFFVITGATDFAGSVQAGMHFERFWLDAVELGISIHPMSQILEEEPFASNAMKELSLNVPVQMIVRAGINSDYGQNNRIRRDIGSFTKQGE